jgi:hypothetical protein
LPSYFDLKNNIAVAALIAIAGAGAGKNPRRPGSHPTSHRRDHRDSLTIPATA